MKVVNYRGLGIRKKIEAMRDLIRISDPNILLIQEMKMEEDDFLRASHLFWKNGERISRSARGASGGLRLLWRRDSFELVQSLTHIHWIFTKLRHKESGIHVSIFNIYITVLLSEKK